MTYSECVYVDLVTQRAKNMRPLIFSTVTCQDLLYFFTLSHKRHDFRKKVTEYEVCVLLFSTTFVWKSFHFKKNLAKYYHNCIASIRVKYTLVLSDVIETWIFSTTVWKILRYKTSWKSVQWEMRCSLRTDRQTDMTKLIVTFLNFEDEPKNEVYFR